MPRLLRRHASSAEDLERQPPHTIVVGAWMIEEILRHAGQPSRTQRIETRQFDRIEDRGGRRFRRAMVAVNGGGMKPSSQGKAIAECAQTAERRGIGAAKHRVGIVGTGQRARARADGLDEAIGKRTRHGVSGAPDSADLR